MKPGLFVAALALAMIVASCGSDGWQTKATLSANDAAARVGSFTKEDRSLYVQGVQHILNQHQRIGAFTIGQVVDQERDRLEHRYDEQRTRTLLSVLETTNHLLAAPVWRGAQMDGHNCSLTIDGNYYEAASAQDQRIIESTADMMCSGAYTSFASRKTDLPLHGLTVYLGDLSGHTVHEGTVMPQTVTP